MHRKKETVVIKFFIFHVFSSSAQVSDRTPLLSSGSSSSRYDSLYTSSIVNHPIGHEYDQMQNDHGHSLCLKVRSSLAKFSTNVREIFGRSVVFLILANRLVGWWVNWLVGWLVSWLKFFHCFFFLIS